MTLFFNIILIIHIICGSLGLLAGLVNIVRTKGDKRHKLVGKLFYFSMLAVGISSLILAYLNPNYFLFMVGVFNLYMVSSGFLYLKLKQPNRNYISNLLLGIAVLMLLCGLLFIGMGVLAIINSNFFGLVFMSFGGLGLLFVMQDYINLKKKSQVRNNWLLAHLQRMTGGFIASLTAFIVVNSKYFPEQVPGFVIWLLPTLIFTPLIIKWSRQYEVKKVEFNR